MSTLPKSVTWQDWATPIKDQAACGSCTAFGSVGVWETEIKIAKNDKTSNPDISEKDLFFCSGGNCASGNNLQNTFNKCVRGVASETCAPYVDKDVSCGSGRCPNWWITGYKLASWNTISGGGQYWELQNNIRNALQTGPLVGVMSVHESFKHYVSGVYHNLGERDPFRGLHCIGIFGYDDDKQAILIRNSWGSDWGEQGYAWISYDECVNGSFIFGTCYKLSPSDDKPEPDPTPPSKSIWQLILDFLKHLFHR
jgi:C1A family cysteine protease